MKCKDKRKFLSLTLFKLRIFLVDDIEATLASNDLALGIAFLN